MTVLFIVGIAGIVMLVAALLVGEILDGFLDIDALAGLDSEVFSTAGIAGLLGGFGFAGAATLHLWGAMPLAIVVGLIVGVALAFGAGKLTAALRRQSTDVTPNTKALLGTEGVVLTPIPRGGYGQIRVSRGGHTHTLNARAELPLEAGTRVWVSSVTSATSVEVSPVGP